MIQTQNLVYKYQENTPLAFADMDFGAGEQAVILGASGCGKTTLLHLLAGLLTPSEGVVRVSNTNLNTLVGSNLDVFRGQKIGIVFQKPFFVQALNVRENVLLAQKLAGIRIDKKRVEFLLETLQIGHKSRSFTNSLSIGEQQRVAIARAVINRPAVLLADEPTSALDDVNCFRVLNLLREQATETQATLLIVTHDNRLAAHFERQITL